MIDWVLHIINYLVVFVIGATFGYELLWHQVKPLLKSFYSDTEGPGTTFEKNMTQGAGSHDETLTDLPDAPIL